MHFPTLPSETASPAAFALALMVQADHGGRPMNSEAARMFISAVDGEELCWSREPAVRLRQMRYAHGVMVRAVLAAISEGRAEITVAMMAGAISADPD